MIRLLDPEEELQEGEEKLFAPRYSTWKVLVAMSLPLLSVHTSFGDGRYKLYLGRVKKVEVTIHADDKKTTRFLDDKGIEVPHQAIYTAVDVPVELNPPPIEIHC
jgi:hypothetical protein